MTRSATLAAFIIAAGTLAAGLTAFNTSGDAAPRRVARGTDTGVAQSLHTVRREGRVHCLVDHFHVGNSSGQRSKASAANAAMRDWSSFTAWEYGTLWGNFRVAANKTVSCDGSGQNWACTVSARPCRR